MPLSMVKAGEPNVIKKVGGKSETKKFLENLGFVVGGLVTVISEINGSLIVNARLKCSRPTFTPAVTVRSIESQYLLFVVSKQVLGTSALSEHPTCRD